LPKRAASALAGLTVALAGCSSASPPAHRPAPDQPQQVTVKVTDQLRFRPSTITVHPGLVRITVQDTGSYPHNLSVPALRKTSSTVSGTVGEQSTTLTLRLQKPGRYRFICTYHSSAGMRGTIVVR
jgi:plastocyanin